MAIPVFDCANWSIRQSSLTAAPTTFSAGRALSGFRQVRRAPNNYWRGTFVLNRIYRRSMIDFRGFISSLQGSSGVFDMCLCEPYAFKDKPRTHEEWLVELGLDISSLCGPNAGRYQLPFSDGMCFSDGTGFHIPDFTAPGLAADAVAGSTTITLNEACIYLRRGNRLSTSDNYLHEITDINGSTATITPPLRRDMVAGEALEGENPKIRVRLSSDTSGQTAENYARWTDEVTLAVEEVFDR